MKRGDMGHGRFEGFSAGLFQFLRDLTENNSREWFDDHRREYTAAVLAPAKTLVASFGPLLYALNQDFDIEPRVGRTVSRINTDLRFQKDRLPYRPFIYVSFPRHGKRWTDEALLYIGIFAHGVTVGFYPGGYRKLRTGPVQERIKKNIRLFRRYLDERRISERYWELAGTETGAVTRWPLPKSASRWVNLESFTVGEYFPATDPVLYSRAFLDRAQQIMLDLYPLWLFAVSDNIREDFELYEQKWSVVGGRWSVVGD